MVLVDTQTRIHTQLIVVYFFSTGTEIYTLRSSLVFAITCVI